MAAPPEQAIPSDREFPVEEARWDIFCQVFAAGGGKVKPACDAAGLLESTVRTWFDRAKGGREPWRTQIAKALRRLGTMAGRVGVALARREPRRWQHDAYPDEYPEPLRHEVQGVVNLRVVVPDFASRVNVEAILPKAAGEGDS